MTSTMPRPTIASLHGIVAAAHPLAAQAGARILDSGGNAFDAAAATAATLNVVEPFMSGLAGLGSATMWVASEARVRVLDFVPAIPASFRPDRFRSRADLQRGPLAVMPPGNLAGWSELAGRYGRLPWSEVLAPAIALAADGFPLAEFGCTEINDTQTLLRDWPALENDWTRTYLSGPHPVTRGTILRQPDLAETYRTIAAEGPDALYKGTIGARIIAHLAATGGSLTMDDLAAVKPVWRDPLVAEYRGLRIHVPPPPCEGFQFLLTLKILEGFDLATLERGGTAHLDLVCRAIRLAAGIRIARNDPDAAAIADIMSEGSVAALRERVRDGCPIAGPTEQWMAEPAPGGEDPGHTTSFSIGDRDGNLVCVTQSLGSPFGSGVVVPGTGICLNNFLFWSDVQPDSPKRAAPGAALPMCMSPSISTRGGRPVLALGTPGSYGIMQTQPQVVVQHVDFGLALRDAVEAPRARLWDGRLVEIEPRIDETVIADLRERGHDARSFPADWSWRVGGFHAVAVDPETGAMTGAADPRRDGAVAAACGRGQPASAA